MKLLIVGSGGREHALTEKLGRDAPEAEIFAAPGNPGIARIARCVKITSDDLPGLADFAEARSIDLTVVGPEAPLAAGVSDLFSSRGLALFGPSRGAARIEASKAFAKRLMRDRGVPTASFETFTDHAAARDYVADRGAPIVVKASGLAAGKGAIVCETTERAETAVDAMMRDGRFGEAGQTVVIEEYMEGIELSTFFLSDGERAIPLPTSRDYKRIDEGDVGPNTGGMGAYSPAGVPPGFPHAVPTSELIEEVRRRIIGPVLEGLAEIGSPYRGFLYAGLMITEAGPKVIEFNCRLGDPEAQAVLPLMISDLVQPMSAIARGEPLEDWTAEAGPGAALVTVLASSGYPESYETGLPIRIPETLETDDVRIYHAGTASRDGELVTAGGRVLAVCGLGADLAEAGLRSLEAAGRVAFEGAHWRRDIGWHELPGIRATTGASEALAESPVP